MESRARVLMQLPQLQIFDIIASVNHNTANHKQRRKQNEEQLDHESV